MTSNANICTSCDSGYTLLLFSPYVTVCAAVDPTTKQCTIDATNFATQATYQTTNSIVYDYISGDSVVTPYCFNCADYFKRTFTSGTTSTTVQLCNTCTQQDISTSFFENSIYKYSQGCSSCPLSSYKQMNVTYHSHLSLYMRECSAKPSTQAASCTLTQTYSTKIKSCVECNTLFPNCASCNSTQCMMCPKGYYLHKGVYDYQSGKSVDSCQFGVCPYGFCREESLNQCIKQDSTTKTSCQTCKSVSGTQTCELCRVGYQISQSTGLCVQLSGQKDINYYINSTSPLLTTDYTYDPTSTGQGEDVATPFLFIQEAITAAIRYQEKNLKSIMNVTIYLGSGDHFLFNCDGTEDYTTFTTFVTICSLFGSRLQQQYFLNDNFSITIKPLYCSLKTILGYTSSTDFTKTCISDANTKPTVYVNQATAYFNISGSLSIENIKFSGINALAMPTDSTQDLSVWPVQFCNVTTDPNGYESAFKIAKKTGTKSDKFTYTCYDKWYTAPQRLDMTQLDRKCQANGNKKFDTRVESTLKCPGDPSTSEYFSQNANKVYHQRRYTLFNLYAFASNISSFKLPPMLSLTKCDFEYFLGGQESLINVENSNLQKISVSDSFTTANDGTVTQVRPHYNFHGADKGVRIKIVSSNFKNSRFCKGMIVYRKPILIQERLSITNYTNIFSPKNNSDSTAYIAITRSNFIQLNIFNNVTAIAAYGGNTPNRTFKETGQLEGFTYRAFMHKGIVLNLEDFGGNVEVSESQFTRNIHYISEAVVYPRKATDQVSVEQFRDSNSPSEYKISLCNPDTRTDLNMFTNGINLDTDMDALFDKFERLSVIYISRNRKMMYFKNNRFYRNTGTFGGAITINSPNFLTDQRPFLVVDSCTFNQNQGYFGGNAMYMRNTIRKQDQGQVCGGAYIINTNFTQNVGLKAHNGGAISGLCEYIDSTTHDDWQATSSMQSIWVAVDMIQDLYEPLDSVLDGASTISVMSFKFNIENSQFIENYSGMKGTAVYLKQMSKIRIVNTVFQNNGPTFSNAEYQYSGQTLYMSNRPISYYDPNEVCLDEFQYMNDCKPTSGLSVDFPRVMGALHIQHCNEAFCMNENDYQMVTIQGCDFYNNDAGPHIKSDYPSDDNAASIYINGGMNTMISRTTFREHKGNHDYYTTNVAPKYGKFFPSLYYTYANSPIVRISLKPNYDLDTKINFNTTFQNCNFTSNKHMQILGSSQNSKRYLGSLLSYETSYTSSSKFLPVLSIVSTTFRDNKFLGNQTSLIYVSQGYLNLTNNTVYGNGYLSNNITRKSGSTELGLDSYTFYQAQQYGFVRLINTEAFPNNTFHIIRGNRFTYNFAQQGAALYLQLTGQFAAFNNNTYRNNFASINGPALFVQTLDSTRSTIKINNDTFDAQFATLQGALTLLPLQQNSLSVVISNSSFRNCFSTDGSSINAQNMAALIVQNSTFWDTSFANMINKTGLIQTAFVVQNWALSELIDIKMLRDMSDGIVRSTGQVYLTGGLNTQAIMFAGNEFIRRVNYTFLQYSEFINCSFEGLSAAQASAMYVANGQQVRITNPIIGVRQFKNMKHKTQGAIKVDYNGTIVMENVTFSGNQATEKGGALYIGTGSTVSVTNAIFTANDAKDRGGCAFVTDQSRFACIQCNFANNTAKQSSTIFAQSNDALPISIQITNSSFTNNTQDNTLMTLYASNTLLTNTTFKDNTARYMTHGLTIISSNVTCNNITVIHTDSAFLRSGSPNVDVGFFSLSSHSNLTVNKSSNFTNLRASQSSVIKAEGFSNVFLDGNTKIVNCLSQSGGNTISLQMATNSVINNTLMNGNGYIDISIDRSQLTIFNTSINQTLSNSIYAVKSNLTMVNSSVMNGVDQLVNGKGVYCNCHLLTVDNCTFQNLSALQGGALYLTSSSQYSVFTIRNSSFLKNQAMQGGAIKLQDAYQMKLSNNRFIQNSAIVIEPQNQQSMRLLQKGQGGAVNMDCNNIPMQLVQNCDVRIVDTNQFKENYAQNDGGAMIYTSNPFYSDRTNNLDRNRAENYGDDLASYPRSIAFEFIDNNDDTNRVTNNRSYYRNLQEAETFPTIVPGIPFSFLAYILDQNGNVYLSDNSSLAMLTSKGPGVSLKNAHTQANLGVFNFSNVLLRVTPGTNVSLSLSTSGIQTYGNDMPEISTPIKIQVATRTCALGEELTEDNSCLQCDSSRFLFIAPSRTTSCKECPSEAICFGKNQVAPTNGYWRWTNDSDIFIKCPNQNACLAGTVNAPTGICAEGYTGILCGNCIDGYHKSQAHECKQCPPMAQNFFFLLILLSIGLIISLVLIRANLFIDEKQSPIYSVYLKIIVSHFQILGIIMNIQYDWPEELQKLQNGYAYFSGISQQIFSYDCFLQSSGFSIEENASKIYQIKLVFFALLPLILFGGIAMFWGLVGMLRKNFYDFKVKTIATTIVIFFIIHPSISRVYFQTFNCIDVAGEKRMKDDLSTICYEGIHMVEIVVLALPSIIGWTFGVPIILLIHLVRNKKAIAQMHQQSQLSKTDQHAVKDLRMKYGFLFTGYKTSIFFWEIIVIYRKIILVMVTVFLTVVSSETQVLAGLLCLIVSMILHVKYEPYGNPRLNRMEHYSLQVTSLTIYAGMFYVTGHEHAYMQGNSVKWFFFFLIVLPNLFFILHWLNQMRIEILKMAFMRGKRMFKLVSLGLVDPQSFEKRHMMFNDDNVEHYDRSVKYSPGQEKSSETTPGPGDQSEFDDFRVKKRHGKHTRGGAAVFNNNSDVASSDSDFKKSLDFDNKIKDPQFDSDRQSSGGVKPPRLNLEGVKLGFPTPMIRRIPDTPEQDDGTTINSRRMTSNRIMDSGASNEGGRTYRDQASYRKIFPEQILTQRGYREDNSQHQYMTGLTDRSRTNMLAVESYDQKKSPAFRQEQSRDVTESDIHEAVEDQSIRESSIQLTGGKKFQQRYQNYEVDQDDININVHSDNDVHTNPQSMKKKRQQDHDYLDSSSVSKGSSSSPAVSEQDIYGEEIGELEESKIEALPSASIDTQRDNYMQQTFKIKESDAFEFTMQQKASGSSPKSSQQKDVMRVEDMFQEEDEEQPKQTTRRKRKKNFNS